jgi:DeoR/GlpR family transcriptional regulator of sugar metabolism
VYANRREDILRFLNQNSNMTVKDLSNELKVSEMTIRRDLAKMEDEGVTKRCFGGVSLAKGLLAQQSITIRAANMPAAKHRMAVLASRLVEDGESVLLDGGTTIFELSKLLGQKPICIATSSLLIALNAGKGVASVHVSGGELDMNYQTLTGRTAEDFYETINCKYAFVGAGGVSIKRGITEFTEDAAALKKTMLAHSKVGILMVDHTKFDTIQMFRAARLDDIDIVITDETPPEEYVCFFNDNCIELMVADQESTEEN